MSDICSECGGTIVIKTGPGRFRRYRGEVDYKIPSDFEIPTCTNCGAEWLTDSEIDVLSEALELQWEERKALEGCQDNLSTKSQ